MNFLPFNKSFVGENELNFVLEAINTSDLSGNGKYTKNCQKILSEKLGVGHTYLTHSATGALEMSAILLNLKEGDEIIMPSFTFVSTANAYVLRGAKPVFIDIRADTLNIDEELIESAITNKTKAIVVVHYGGVSCEMDKIMKIANDHNIPVIEDAAQGICAYYKNRPLGTIGEMGAISFHSTKNISCGEGGAFITNSELIGERAEIIREKGTDRSRFLRGLIDKYSWVDCGSSFLPSELNAAYLLAQLNSSEVITNLRKNIWNQYHDSFIELHNQYGIGLPTIPVECEHNAHIYYLIMESNESRNNYIDYMKANNVGVSFHYVPLHSATFAKSCSRVGSNMKNTDNLSEKLVRLPLWPGMEKDQQRVIDLTYKFFK